MNLFSNYVSAKSANLYKTITYTLIATFFLLSCKDVSDDSGGNGNAPSSAQPTAVAIKLKAGKTAEATESATALDLNSIFDVTVNPSNAEDKSVSWSLIRIEDKDKAILTTAGMLTPNEAGTITLVLKSKAKSSVTAETTFTIKKRQVLATDIAPTAIAIDVNEGKNTEVEADAAELDLHTIFNIQFTPPNTTDKRLSWSLKDPADASKADLTATGILSPKRAGTITLTATSKAESSVTATATFAIKRLARPTDIAPAAITVSLKTGKSAEAEAGDPELDLNTIFDVAFDPDNTSDKGVSWSLKDPADGTKADLSAAGKLSPKAAGTITLVVSANAKDTVTAEVDFTIIKSSGLKKIIQAGEIPSKSALSTYSQELQDLLRPLAGNTAKSLEVLYVSEDGGSTPQDGSTRQKAYAATELKTAIDEAGDAAGANNPYLVVVAPGTYNITTTLKMKNNVAIVGGFAENGSLSTEKTIFDGLGRNQVFNSLYLDKYAVLYGVTIRNGNARSGAGMANNNASPSLIQVVFTGNTASSSGGGMYNIGSSAPSLTGVVFSKNEAKFGGGMLNSDSSPSLTQVTFSENLATFGGGIYNNDHSAPSFTNVSFSKNIASSAGGMYNNTSSPSLTRVTFSENKAYRAGGMLNDNSSSPSFIDVSFSGNTATGSGGGMFNRKLSSPDLRGVTFSSASKNTAGGLGPDFLTTEVFAGGTRGFLNEQGTAAKFNNIDAITVAANGDIYAVDSSNLRIRKITPSGLVSTFAGSGIRGNIDEQSTKARFSYGEGITVDSAGNIYVSDTGNNRIRKITPSGLVSTFAGSSSGFTDTDGLGTVAQFDRPRGIAVAPNGNFYVVDLGNARIRKITPDGVVSTFAGNGKYDFTDGQGKDAAFNNPHGIAVAPDGNFYVADRVNNSIRKITPSGLVSTLAGGTSGSADGQGTDAQFDDPWDIAVGPDGNIYVGEKGSNRIRKITPSGLVSTAISEFDGPIAFSSDGSTAYVAVDDVQIFRLKFQ